MVALRPSPARVVDPAWAARVVGPAYDALTAPERDRLRRAEPDSFFNVVRSPAEAPDVPADVVLDEAAAALRRLVAGGRYGPAADPPGLFLYRLGSPEHDQVAVVGDLATSAVREGQVRPHERTRTAKEDELARHLSHLAMSSSPVGLTYRPVPAIDELVAEAQGEEPLVRFTSPDGVAQEVWAVPRAVQEELLERFAAVTEAYIVDGHHRVAATLRVGHGAFLAALVPSDQLRLLAYHRVLDPPLPVPPTALAASLGGVELAAPTAPSAPGTAVLYGDGRWWELPLAVAGGRRLDVVAVDEDVLPALGVVDPRRDPRLEFVPGQRELHRVAELADERGGVGLVLHPPTVGQLMAEADAGRTLPPKSTWFEPKLRSGVFVVER